MLFALNRTTEQIDEWLSHIIETETPCAFPPEWKWDCDPKSAEHIQVTLIDLGQGKYTSVTHR